jgi:peroxiredoxin
MNRWTAMEAFVRVVDAGSFSAAARHLHLGQPAVSKMIAQLEKRLGVRLLLRSTQGLAPTEAGQGFYERAKRAIEEADEAETAARGANASLSGELRISAATTFARLHGAKLVAISPQTPVNSRKSVRQNKLSFSILSDKNNDVADAFGLKFTLPDYLVELYKNLKNDLPAFNGDPSWTLPMPTRFVIAPDRTIVYAEVNPDYTLRPEPEAMLPALRKIARVAA